MQVKTKYLKDLSVTEPKLADGAVTSRKIAEGAIDPSKFSTTVFPTLFGYNHRLAFEWVSVSQIRLKAGRCSSDDDTIIMILPSDIIVDISTLGKNGLDVATELSASWYYLYLMYNPTTLEVAGLLSLSNPSPSLPAGFTFKRILGTIRNSTTSNILKFIKNRFGSRCETRWLEESNTTLRVLSNGSAVVYTPIDLSGLVSPISDLAMLQDEINTAILRTRPGGSAIAIYHEVGNSQISNYVSAVSNTQTIEYECSSPNKAAYISVLGYIEDGL